MSDSWADEARCREVGIEIFFPYQPTSNADYREARKVCAICPVRQTCLDTALAAEGDSDRAYRGGIWGGLTPGERHDLAHARDEAAADGVAAA